MEYLDHTVKIIKTGPDHYLLRDGFRHALVYALCTGISCDKKSPVFMRSIVWCPETESNRHVPFGTRDFKSRASASFAIRAGTKPLKRIYIS